MFQTDILVHLTHLFLEGHPPQKVFHPFFDWSGSILVEWKTICGTGNPHHRQNRQDCHYLEIHLSVFSILNFQGEEEWLQFLLVKFPSFRIYGYGSAS